MGRPLAVEVRTRPYGAVGTYGFIRSGNTLPARLGSFNKAAKWMTCSAHCSCCCGSTQQNEKNLSIFWKLCAHSCWRRWTVADAALPSVKELQLPVRVLHLPVAFEDKWTKAYIQR